ncbi:Ist1p [Sugiyamaella lignohabitans]|uniref:Ist1p n=1 Tax=Sugiyamaella lignohabitans TaxID=796027 RepID=A0A167C3B5_9ASCO|nr:Ist1p [Sugiyamaella lignohabitans]ANB11166.1 Ist1p [Sugiyamaella lignohabitans]
MAVNRLRLIEQKETALAKQARRESRDCDPGLEEAVKTIIYSAQRTEVKELHQIREIFVHKFGKDFAQDSIDNLSNSIPEKVTKRLSTVPPSEELVTLYLAEIARAYHVPFSGLQLEGEDITEHDESGDEGPPSGRVPEEALSTGGSQTARVKVRRLSQVDKLPNPSAPKSPVSVSTPAPTTDNPHPVLRVSTSGASQKGANGKANSADEQELDALRNRFEALRRR